MARSLLAVIACAALLLGCSPSHFEKPVASFASSLTSLSNSLAQSAAALGVEEAEARHEAIRARGVRPVLSVACTPGTEVTGPEGQRLPACGLVENARDEPTVAPVWTTRTVAVQILEQLALYADGLKDLASAENRAATDAAVDTIAVGVAAVLTLAGPETAVAAPVVAAGIKLIGFAIAEAEDARRYRLLRASVQQGERAINTTVTRAGVTVRGPVGIVLRDAFVGLNQARIGYGLAIGNDIVRTIRPGSRDFGISFERVAQQALRIEALQRSDPGAAVSAMIRAHGDLARAIANNDGQLTAATVALAEFASRAAALRTAIEAASN